MDLKEFWKKWDLRAMVLFTLSVQTVLLLLGNRRKSNHKVWLRVLVWCAYMTSDSVVIVALGVLSSKLGHVNSLPVAYWAPLLLLLLGGPDTITAYSLEDNALWLRHLLSLGVQVVATAYVLLNVPTVVPPLPTKLGLQFMATAPSIALPPDVAMAPSIALPPYVAMAPSIALPPVVAPPPSIALPPVVAPHLFVAPPPFVAPPQFIAPSPSVAPPPILAPCLQELVRKPIVIFGFAFVMFLVGLIKYGERTCVLWLASKDNLRQSLLNPPDPSPNYSRFMEEYSLKQAEGYHVTVDEVIEVEIPAGPYPRGYLSNVIDAQDPLCENTVPLTVKAYELLQIVKRLFVDLILSYDDRDLSLSIFNNISWEDAFQLIAIELGFMYDFLYTKAMLFYSVRGLRRRFISFSLTLMLAVLVILITYAGKEKIDIDLCITYALVAVIILFEIYSILIFLSSDWTDVWLSVHNKSRALRGAVTCVQLPKQPRWSDSISQFSLLEFCINENPLVCHGIFKCLNINEMLDKYRYTNFEKIPPNLKEKIFGHVKVKSEKLEKPTDINQIRRVLSECGHPDEMWSPEAEFDQIILTWHVATELCYYSERLNESKFPNYKLSKLLSRYMFYLLVRYPSTLPHEIGQVRIRDTFAEATKFFEEHPIKEQTHSNARPEESHGASSNEAVHRSRKTLQLVCDMLLKVNTEVPLTKVKGGRSESVFFDGCRLATVLNKVERIKKWEMMENLWVEVLLYAASQSRGDCHADQLRRGGELLTHVWLLLAHFGLTDHFKMTQGHAIAKLILR